MYHQDCIIRRPRVSVLLIVTTIILHSCIPTDAAGDCKRNVTACIPMNASVTCMGAKLLFTHTFIAFASDSTSLTETLRQLTLWNGLQNVPQCWAVVQPFLCSVYMPMCNQTSLQVDLPSKKLCEATRGPCKIVEYYSNGWPDFLACDHDHFQESCSNDAYDKITFNTTGACEPPLVATNNPDSYYEDVEGCGIQCQNPLFTDAEHYEVHVFVAVFGSLCLMSTLFTLLTFIIDWKNANRYPALILFFINACFFLGSIGWLAQFAGNARQDIVCRSDGTMRRGEPQIGSGETASCTFVFLMVYYFMMAGVTWFMMLAYAWDITFKALGTPRDHLSGKTAYFHLVSWLSPLVLSIICLAVSEIDGDSLSGICFVGYNNHWIRGGFVLLPIAIVLAGGLFFLVRGLVTLIKLRNDTPGVISDKATSKIRETIFRIGIFALLAIIFVIITLGVHIYTFTQEGEWKKSLKDYAICEANVKMKSSVDEEEDKCVIKNRPSLVAVEIHIFAFFGCGIVMSSWSWTKATLSAWERFLRKVFKKPSNKPVKIKRHKMIAHAFAKRKEINNGRLSISFASTHDDPLGMKFDLNSVSSHEMSSNFAAAMPKLIRRRGGMMLPVAGTLRRYSDSDIQSIASQLSTFAQAPGQISDHEQPIPKKKSKTAKKKLRKKTSRIQPILGPISKALRSSRHAVRRASDSSVISRASAHGIRVSLEKNSMETVSISSRPPSQNSISDIELPAQTRITNFSIFTASSLTPAQNDKQSKSNKNNPEQTSHVQVNMSEAKFYTSRSRRSKRESQHSAKSKPGYGVDSVVYIDSNDEDSA